MSDPSEDLIQTLHGKCKLTDEDHAKAAASGGDLRVALTLDDTAFKPL